MSQSEAYLLCKRSGALDKYIVPHYDVLHAMGTNALISDFTKAITKPTSKEDIMGNAMYVWQDFVAGTDPTNPDEKFTASITFDSDGKPLIAYSPKLSEEETAKRKYTTYGKAKLTDKDWTPVADGDEANYNFFKVSVEMR